MGIFNKNMPSANFTVNENGRPYYENSMYNAYNCCFNLTGSSVCGDNIVNMAYAYSGCNNLTGSPICGPNVVNMAYAYNQCDKFRLFEGDFIIESKNVSDFSGCIDRISRYRLNIFVYPNSISNTTLYTNADIIGTKLTWEHNTSNKCYYNTARNIYCYYTL